MFTKPQDYFKAMTDAYSTFPKTPEDVKVVLGKTKNIVDAEAAKVKKIISVCNKSATGNASVNEIHDATDTVKDLLVTARFAAVMAIPGTVFILPALSKLADEYDFHFVPQSVKKEFSI